MPGRKNSAVCFFFCFLRSPALLFLISVFISSAAEIINADICIYGGTACGVATAVQASRMGRTVVIAEFSNHLGGMTSGGLGATDIGNKKAIGGIAREFYQRVARRYANEDAWQFETREEFFNKAAGRASAHDLRAPDATMWVFEPHVAEDILFQMLNEAKAPVYFGQRLSTAKKENFRIREIEMENEKIFARKYSSMQLTKVI